MKTSPAKSRVWAVALLAGVLPSLSSLGVHWLFGSTRHVQELLHQCLEISGSWIALTVALLIWLRAASDKKSSHLVPVAAALAGMGLLDGVHGLAPFGVAWSWLRHGATLLGGLVFALVWLPETVSTVLRRRFFILSVSALAIAGWASVCFYPGWFAAPWGTSGYSLAAQAANVLGGLGFLAAALFFVRRYFGHPAADDLIFAGHTLLFASSGLLFGFSHVWAADWWVWHGFRLLAYGIVAMAAYEMMVTLYRRIARHAQELEDRVQLRTLELQQLAAIIESSEDAIIGKSLDGVITSWNKGAERLYGYSADEAIGQPMTWIVPPELRHEVQVLVERILDGQSVQHHETVRLRKDGRRVDVSVTLSPIKDFAGRITGASASARDITAQKEAERERRRAEQELEQFFTITPDMLCIAGFDGYFKRVNPAWTSELGWTVEELLRTPFEKLIHPDDVQATQRAVQDQSAGETIVAFENRYRARNGSYHWMQWRSRANPERDLIFAAARDVTAERQAADEVHQASAYNRSLIEASLDPLVTIAPDGRITDVNQATEQATGFTRQELIGTDFCDYFTDPGKARAGYRRVFEKGWTQNYELELRHRNGSTRPVVYNASVYRNQAEETVGVFAAARDIAERKRVEDELKELNASLEERVVARTADLLALNQELEAFNYSVSHDLRAPLRHIDGYSKILIDTYRANLPEEGRQYIDRIRGGARRMGRMVDELLELSRISRRELSRQLTGLRTLVANVVEELALEIQDREIEWRIGELPFAHRDPALTRQVLINLIANAIKFTRDRNPAVIEVGQTVWGGQTALFVRDNGVGFNMKYADKLFGVFQRLHRREDFDGTGVGLATVQRIIQKHGGRIWAEAELEKGATFYFTLSAHEAPPVNPINPEPTRVLAGERR